MWPEPVMRSMLSSSDSFRTTPTSAEARGLASAMERSAKKMGSMAARIAGAEEERPLVKRRRLETRVDKQPPRVRRSWAPLIEHLRARRVAWIFVKWVVENGLRTPI